MSLSDQLLRKDGTDSSKRVKGVLLLLSCGGDRGGCGVREELPRLVLSAVPSISNCST